MLLELYIEKGAHNKPVISLLLEKVDTIARISSKVHEHAFEIKSGEKNLFCVAAESEIEAFEWMDIFHQHLLEPRKEIGRLPDIEDGTSEGYNKFKWLLKEKKNHISL